MTVSYVCVYIYIYIFSFSLSLFLRSAENNDIIAPSRLRLTAIKTLVITVANYVIT